MVQPTVKTEMLVNGTTWTDITGYTFSRNGNNVRRGVSNEGGQTEATGAAFTLNNIDGRFSPRNPNSPYYGQIGRNTRIRGYVEQGTKRLLQISTGGYFSAADSAGLSVTGDIDLRIEISLPTWRPANSSYIGLLKSQSYGLFIGSGGSLNVFLSDDGTTSRTVSSQAVIPGMEYGKKALRVTVDVNNGAGGRTATFYYSDTGTLSGTWVQFDQVIATTAISIFNSTQPLLSLASGDVLSAEIYKMEVYSGIAGTLVASPDFTAQTNNTASFADAQANTWTKVSDAVCGNRRTRFNCEASAWPNKWDVSGADSWVEMEAYGLLRRLGQGSAPVLSTMRRGVTSLTGDGAALAYWPMEDGARSAFLASGIPGGKPMTYVGNPRLATSTAFDCASVLPEAANATFKGAVTKPSLLSPAQYQVRFLTNLPSASLATNTIILRVAMAAPTGSSVQWDLIWETGGTLRLKSYDRDGTALVNQAAAFVAQDKQMQISLEWTQAGATTTWNVVVLPVGVGLGGSSMSNTIAGTFTRVSSVTLCPLGGVDACVFGHLAVYGKVTSIFDLASQLNAYTGETAGARIERLCGEAGIVFARYGEPRTTELMGPQRVQGLLSLIREAVAVDQGVLLEERERLALGYKPRTMLHNRAADITLSHSGGDVSALEPVDDDQQTRNDVTVSRPQGASARVTLDSGALSTQAPPLGVGTYDTSVEVNVYNDLDTIQQAGWRIGLGTVDEPRYPNIVLNLASPNFLASSTLVTDALDLDAGDRILINNPPPWMPPEAISQIVVGYAELVADWGRALSIVCVPETPYHVLVWNDSQSRWSPATSTLNASLTTTATSISLATPAGEPLWTTTPAHFPFDIMVTGERITLTAISGTSSPQTGTGTRSVNGIVKAHSAGEAVELFRPSYWAL